ncbi:MAG: alpha/beta fold hydrolase [Gammaproteobacteria bacterium]|nr:alpha/beta fold hydrolase [Gammaproteobacteria bacterium]
MGQREVVVLVHGIWMTGIEMSLLRHRLTRCGFETYRFHYPSLRGTPHSNAKKLHRFLRKINAPTIHLVAHSLGGIVLLHLFHSFSKQKPGRVVMLGTPAQGSVVAKKLSENILLHYILGKATKNGLLGDVPDWPCNRELGLIAGYREIGVGKLLTGSELHQPNDGTVALEETQIQGATDVLHVNESHMSMLVDKTVAKSVCAFLRNGSFTN